MIIDGRECCVADILNIIFETEGAILHTWLPPELLSNWRQPSGWNTRWRLQAGRRLGFGYRGVVLRSCHWQIIFLEQIPASKKYKEVLTGGQWLAAILEGWDDRIAIIDTQWGGKCCRPCRDRRCWGGHAWPQRVEERRRGG